MYGGWHTASQRAYQGLPATALFFLITPSHSFLIINKNNVFSVLLHAPLLRTPDPPRIGHSPPIPAALQLLDFPRIFRGEEFRIFVHSISSNSAVNSYAQICWVVHTYVAPSGLTKNDFVKTAVPLLRDWGFKHCNC